MNKPNLEYSLLRREDNLTELVSVCRDTVHEKFASQLRTAARDHRGSPKRCVVYVAVQGEKPVGIATMRTHWHSPKQVKGRLGRIFVHPRYRGMKIARELISKQIEHARANNLQSLSVMLGANLRRLIPSYEKHGFVLTQGGVGPGYALMEIKFSESKEERLRRNA